jgi:PAS domain S-box-containing protein
MNEALFHQVWQHTSDAMALSDSEGIVLLANPAYLSLYGYRLADVIGNSFAIIFPEAAREQALQQYKAIFAGGVTPVVYESVVHRADGSQRIVEASATFLTEEGKRTAMLSTIRDITERKRHEEEMRQVNETLEARVRERTAVLSQREAQLHQLAARLTIAEQEERQRISQVLHDDLQQLLYGARMQVELLADELEANSPHGTATRLQGFAQLLGNAIDVTRHLTVELSPPFLKGEGLDQALPWLATHMERTNGLHVDVRIEYIPEHSSLHMRTLLFQIIRELLFNICKHARTNSAMVELRRGNADDLVVRVVDQGRGFEAKNEALVEGHGYGLYSVRERLRLFGGTMSIDSAPGQGTKVTITVPLSSL